MNIRERIKKVRLDKDLDQEQFGIKLGVGRGVISNIELEHRGVEIKPLFIQHLCEIFNVNREWLETGKGEPYLVTDESYINSLKMRFGDKVDDLLSNIVKAYIDLDKDERAIINNYLEKIINSTTEPNNLTAAIPSETKPKILTRKERKEAFMKMANDNFEMEEEQEKRTSSANAPDAV